MNKHLTIPRAALGAFVLLVGVAIAAPTSWREYIANLRAGNLTVDTTIASTGAITATGGITVGTGTAVTNVLVGTGQILSGQTSVAATLTGVAASDKVFATISGGGGTATVLKAVPTTNTVTVTLSADPATTTTLSILAVR